MKHWGVDGRVMIGDDERMQHDVAQTGLPAREFTSFSDDNDNNHIR